MKCCHVQVAFRTIKSEAACACARRCEVAIEARELHDNVVAPAARLQIFQRILIRCRIRAFQQVHLDAEGLFQILDMVRENRQDLPGMRHDVQFHVIHLC